MIVVIVTIEEKVKQHLKQICQKNKISKISLKKKLEIIILEIKGRLYVS